MPLNEAGNAPKPKVEPPKVEPVAAVTKDELDKALATEREKMAADKAALAQQAEIYQSRMQQLETILSDRIAGKTPPPEAPMVPTVTDEDFLTPDGARKAAERLAEEKAVQVAKAIDANYRGTMTQMLEDQFDSKLEAMKTREFFKYVEKDIMDAIKKNPQIRLAPRALDILYNSFVGARGTEIVAAEKKADIERQTLPSGDVGLEAGGAPNPVVRENVGSGDGRPRRPAKGPVLSEREEQLRRSFGRFLRDPETGETLLTAERWAEIRAQRAEYRGEPIPNLEENKR